MEDHAESARVAARLLAGAGFHVVTTGDVHSARAAASQGQFNLVLCDIGLPDGDGCELMRELQSLYALPGIALTGYSMPADDARIDAAGFAARLLKPIDFGDLCRAIDQVLATADVAIRPKSIPSDEGGIALFSGDGCA